MYDRNHCQFCLPLIQCGRILYSIRYENRKFNIGNWWIKLRMPIYPIFCGVYGGTWWFSTTESIIPYTTPESNQTHAFTSIWIWCSIRTPWFKFMARFAGCGLCRTNKIIDYIQYYVNIFTWVSCVQNGLEQAHFTSAHASAYILDKCLGWKWTILNFYVININFIVIANNNRMQVFNWNHS